MARVAWLFVFVLVLGCQRTDEDDLPVPGRTSTAIEKPQKITILSVDDGAGIAERLAQVWRAQTTGEVQIVSSASSELFGASSSELPAADVVLYPNVMLGEMLAREEIQPIDLELLRNQGIDRRALLRHDRTTVVQNGKSVYGASLGTPLPMMLYRKDVFAALKLNVPQTWTELHAVLEALHAAGPELKGPAGEKLPHTVYIPGDSESLVAMFLNRAAGAVVRQGRLSTFFEVDSMNALLDSPPFTDALERMLADQSLISAEQLSPADCYARLMKGEAALVIAWPSGQPSYDNGDQQLSIGIAPLPAADRSYDYRQQKWEPVAPDARRTTVLVPLAGWQASIAAGTRKLKTAQRFVAWLMTEEANREFSTQFLDTLLIQYGQLEQPFLWVNQQLPRETAQQMADALRMYHDQAHVMANLVVPQRSEYVRVLAAALGSALAGEKSAPQALGEAAQQWNALTDQLGREKLRKMFQGSIGLTQ